MPIDLAGARFRLDMSCAGTYNEYSVCAAAVVVGASVPSDPARSLPKTIACH